MRASGLAVIVLVACGAPSLTGHDAGVVTVDAGMSSDAGVSTDAGGPSDAGLNGRGGADAGPSDAGGLDAGPDCTPVVLDLSTPFATSTPPFATRAGQQMPSALWGSVPAPRPTNAAWENFVLGPGQNRVDFLPYQLKVVPEGLVVALASPVNTANAIDVPDVKQLVLSSTVAFSAHGLVSYDAFSATMKWSAAGGSMTAPMVFGMPYVTAEYAGLRPTLLTGAPSLSSVNGVSNPASATGTRFELALSDGSTWLVYASSAVTFDWSRRAMTARAAFTGTLRVASLQRRADAAILDAHAETVPSGGHLEVTSACDLATMRFVFTSTGSQPLLMNALPHHLARLVMPALVDLAYPTLSGTLRGIEGNTWSMTLPLTTITWSSPSAINAMYAPAVQSALSVDAAATPSIPTDPYFGGKALARLARLALIADDLDDSATAAAVRAKLSPLLGAWLEGTNQNPLVFDQTWGGVLTTSSLANPGNDFGSGHYNDHHFHWGYFLYAAAAMSKNDPAFVTAHHDALLALVRDIANPSAADPRFPPFRSMDFFRGHSWAAGLSEFADGQNQESSSEAANAWYGLHLLGLAMHDQRMSDLGRLLLRLETDAAQTYWQLPSQSPVYGYPFKANRSVGILFETRAFFGTFFASGPQFVFGIQMLPFTPITEALLSKPWVSDAWVDMSAAATSATPEWQGFLYMTHATIDRTAAWAEVSSLARYDDGNSKTNTLWWVATRP